MKKRPDGRYQISIMVGYKENGKPRLKVVYGKTQKEVKDKASALRMQYNMGLKIDHNITISDWADTWVKTYKGNLAYKTRKMYEDTIRIYVTSTIGHMKLRDVKLAHLQKIVNDNSSKGRTMKILKLTLLQLFDQAIINDLLIKNPAKGIQLPVVELKSVKRALTDEEVDTIKSLEFDAKAKCFVMLLMYTGLRKGEALALTKADIDKENLTINVDKTLVFKVNQSEVKYSTKTKSGVRVIPILEPLRKTLFDYMDSIHTDFIFTSNNGSTLSDTAYRRMWAKFEKVIGKKDITAHIFRHNFATILYNAGVDIKSAQDILGHSSIQVTMDIYTHLGNQRRTETTEKLNLFLSGLSD